MRRVVAILTFLLATYSYSTAVEYGLDVSFPIHHPVSQNYAWLPHNNNESAPVPPEYKDKPIQPLGDRMSLYTRHLQNCRDVNAPHGGLCDRNEYDRMLMNLRQPQSMQNYTDVGFKKTRAPDEIIKLAKNFWEKNQLNRKEEWWGQGNTYVNSWEAPTYLVSIDDNRLRGAGSALKTKLWDAAQMKLEEWTGEELSPTSMYGIRVYTTGAIMLPHVDRLPLVSSCMINVAQDVDEDWPMEIYDHNGRAHNITMEPGDMLFFESHSVVHGRPFPLKGRFYAMLFIHFEPVGHSLKHGANSPAGNVDRQYRQATADGVGGQSADGSSLPPYIRKESPEEEHWRSLNPAGWKEPNEAMLRHAMEVRTAYAAARKAAVAGDAENLLEEISKTKEQETKNLMNERDKKGWQLLHLGVKSGALEVVQLLVKSGANINTRTNGGRGSSPLNLAEKFYGKVHPVVKYLTSLGALNIEPDEL